MYSLIFLLYAASGGELDPKRLKTDYLFPLLPLAYPDMLPILNGFSIRYIPPSEGMERTTKTQRTQRLIDHIVS
jgi:hypothetical protein